MGDCISHFKMPNEVAFCTWCVYNQMFICHADVDVLGLMDSTPPMLQAEPPAEDNSTSPLCGVLSFARLKAS